MSQCLIIAANSISQCSCRREINMIDVNNNVMNFFKTIIPFISKSVESQDFERSAGKENAHSSALWGQGAPDNICAALCKAKRWSEPSWLTAELFWHTHQNLRFPQGEIRGLPCLLSKSLLSFSQTNPG